MSKETLQEAIGSVLVTETIKFTRKAMLDLYCDALQQKKGPNNIFQMIRGTIHVSAPTTDKDWEVVISGSISDVCVAYSGYSIGYSEVLGTYSIETAFGYLRNKYGFSFKHVCGCVNPTLDMTWDMIVGVLGEERAAALGEPTNVPVSATIVATKSEPYSLDSVTAEDVSREAVNGKVLFTPNEHSIESIAAPYVTETFVFDEPIGQEAFNVLMEAKFKYGFTLGGEQTIILKGTAVEVCAGIMFVFDFSHGLPESRAQLLDHLSKKYMINTSAINGRLAEMTTARILEQKRLDPYEPIMNKSEEDIETIMTRIRENHSFTPVSFEDAMGYPKSDPSRGLIRQCLNESGMTSLRKQVLGQKQGFYRKRLNGKDILLTSSFEKDLNSSVPQYRVRQGQQDALILGHFGTKAVDIGNSQLEDLGDSLYSEAQELFMALRNPDVDKATKVDLLNQLREYATLPMLILAIEQHYQSSDM